MAVKAIDEAAKHQPMLDILKGLLNRCMGKAGLAEGTDANTVKTITAVDFCIAGIMYTKAITDNLAITAGSVQAISTFRRYLVSIDAAGAVTVTAGVAAATSALALMPDIPADEAPIGYFEIATNGSTTYTPGTTDNGAAGITDLYYDLGSMVTET